MLLRLYSVFSKHKDFVNLLVDCNLTKPSQYDRHDVQLPTITSVADFLCRTIDK